MSILESECVLPTTNGYLHTDTELCDFPHRISGPFQPLPSALTARSFTHATWRTVAIDHKLVTQFSPGLDYPGPTAAEPPLRCFCTFHSMVCEAHTITVPQVKPTSEVG